MARPVILIAGEYADDGRGGSNFVIRSAYTQAVRQAGGLPVVALGPMNAAAYAEDADALLLTGGPVIHPGRYGSIIRDFAELAGFSQGRDEQDFALTKAFVSAGKPVFGIGRGLAVLNVYLGGDIVPPASKKAEREADLVVADAVPGSFVEKTCGRRSLQNQFYRWRPGRIGAGLRVAATDRAGWALAVENEEKRLYGTLWHPEMAVGDSKRGDALLAFYLDRAVPGRSGA